jgi:hypothetical protein
MRPGGLWKGEDEKENRGETESQLRVERANAHEEV